MLCFWLISPVFAQEEENGNLFYMVMIEIKPGKVGKYLELYEKTNTAKDNEFLISEKVFTHRTGPEWSILLMREYKDFTAVQKALLAFYRRQAQSLFEERMALCFNAFPQQGLSAKKQPTVTIRKMRRRWGSCSSRGDVTLNLLLMRMPVSCIDYVIIHELCHLWEFNHGVAFYRLMARALPDWRVHKEQLESWPEY